MPFTSLRATHEQECNLYLLKIEEIMQQKDMRPDAQMSNVYSLAKILQAYEQSVFNTPVSFQKEV
ncbi:MAG: hypothetical protein J0I41_10775 [Filimonas sp.]|nr:hypothetical protein [Filimonas sp.]